MAKRIDMGSRGTMLGASGRRLRGFGVYNWRCVAADAGAAITARHPALLRCLQAAEPGPHLRSSLLLLLMLLSSLLLLLMLLMLLSNLAAAADAAAAGYLRFLKEVQGVDTPEAAAEELELFRNANDAFKQTRPGSALRV
ncbi:hypothetical protein ACSSS7_003123 [Eimeria intestinalis]